MQFVPYFPVIFMHLSMKSKYFLIKISLYHLSVSFKSIFLANIFLKLTVTIISMFCQDLMHFVVICWKLILGKKYIECDGNQKRKCHGDRLSLGWQFSSKSEFGLNNWCCKMIYDIQIEIEVVHCYVIIQISV